MGAASLLLILAGIVTDQDDPDTCDLLVRVEEQDGQPAPADLWVRAQFIGGPSVAAPLDVGVAALRTRCGLHRVQVGSPGIDPSDLGTPRTEVWVHPLTERTAMTRLDRVTEVWLFLPRSADVRLEALGPRDNPLPGFHLYARAVGQRAGFSLVTGKDGRGRFRGKLGLYDLYWMQADVRSVDVQGMSIPPGPMHPVRARVGAEGLEVVVRLDDVGPAEGSVRSSYGSPLPGVEVLLERPDVASRGSLTTDVRGRFSAPLVRPPATLRPHDPSGRWIFDPPLATCAGIPCHVAFTACEADTGCLHVRVVDGEEQPIEQAALTASAACAGEGTGFVAGTQTDAGGRALLPCPRCPLSVRTVKHGWLERSERLLASSCGHGLEHVIRLTHGAVVRGRVLDVRGQPQGGLPVRVSVGEWLWSLPALTNADGWFEIDGVPSGFQRLQLDGDGDLALVRCEPACRAAGVQVHADEVHDLSLRTMEGGRICAAAPTQGRACVRVLSQEAGDLLAAAQGELGQRSVCSDPLPPGDYAVLDCSRASSVAPVSVRVAGGEIVRLLPAP
jgi:hypothetical protein